MITAAHGSAAAHCKRVAAGGGCKDCGVPAAVDPVTEAVRADLHQRSAVGIAKYGVTLARTDLSLRDWLQHAYEEHLDAAQYLKRAIMELDRTLPK